MKDSPQTQRILAAIRAIPHGQVCAYGQVAARAGLPGRARLVARVLAESSELNLPWHRVLRTSGYIAFAPDSEMYTEQCRRLHAEGVEIKSGRVRMPTTSLDLDALLWAPK